MSLITEESDTVVCLARKGDLLDLANRISEDPVLQSSLHHLTLKEFQETRTQYVPGSAANLSSNRQGGYREVPIPTPVPVEDLQQLLQMLSAHATSLTHLTLDGLCGPNRASEEQIDSLLSLGDLIDQLPSPYQQFQRTVEPSAPRATQAFQRTILEALVSLDFTSLKCLSITHLASDHHIATPTFGLEGLLEKLQTLCVVYDTDGSLQGGAITPVDLLTKLPFSWMAVKTNLQSLTLHSIMPVRAFPDVVTFPNLEMLSLAGFILGSETSPVEDFILAQSQSLKSLELINCPILVSSNWNDGPWKFPARLCQMGDVLDKLRTEMTRLCTFRYLQNKKASWNVYVDERHFAEDEDANVWIPRKCYVRCTTWIAEWLVEDFEEAPYRPDFARDNVAFERLVEAVKARL